MHFLAQVHTDLLRENCKGSGQFLPDSGALCFFADTGNDCFLEGAVRYVKEESYSSVCTPPEDTPKLGDGQLSYEFKERSELARQNFFPSYTLQSNPALQNPENKFQWGHHKPVSHYLFGKAPVPQGDGHYDRFPYKKPCHLMTFNNDPDLGWHFGCYLFWVSYEDLQTGQFENSTAFMVYD